MGSAAFIRQCRQLTPERFLRASTEAGRIVPPPVADSDNNGQARLRGSGEALSSVILDLALTAGGNITGYSTIGSGVPGAAARWKNSTDGSTLWRGYTDVSYFTWARLAALATATVDYPGHGTARTLANGALGLARVERDTVGGNELQFCYKATRTATWTTVSITIVATAAQPEPASSPDFVVMASGRLVLFYLTTGYEIRALYSDDHGATWAQWSGNTGVLMTGAYPCQVSAEVVDDAICLIVSMAPTATAQDAYVGWSNNGGASFTRAGSLVTWGPTRTCVTRTGVVLACATNQSAASVGISQIVRNGSPGTLTGTNLTISHHATGVSPAIVCHDDGIVWLYGSANQSPAPTLTASFSDDHGATWRIALTGADTGSASPVWNLGVASGALRGFRTLSAGTWQGRVVVVGGTDVNTAAKDDSLVEMHFGGWETLTEAYSTSGRYLSYGASGAGGYLPMDTPDTVNWTATNVAAGATVTIVADGLNIVSTAANNTYYTATAADYWAAAGHNNGVRIKLGFYVTSGGSIADNRSSILLSISDGVNRQTIVLRLSANQIRIVDGAGTTMGTSSLTVGQFSNPTEILIAFDEGVTATTGAVSAWVRASAATDAWEEFCTAATVSEQVGVGAQVIIGGTVAGASDWTLMYGPILAADDNDLAATTFTNPTELTGRQLAAGTDFVVTAGHRLGGAGGAGVQGDVWTWTTGASYSGAWLVRSLSPSRQHRATGDNATHEVVFDAGTTAIFSGDFAGLVGTNFRTATVQVNGTDSWATPSGSFALDATVWEGTIGATKGAGYFQVDGSPWTPHAWQSITGRRWFLEVGSQVAEITDNGSGHIEVDGVDFSALSGTVRIFGDRMYARSGTTYRYRFLRVLVSAQQTPSADNAYQIGTLIYGAVQLLTVPYALGYVTEQPDPSQVYTTDLGYRSATARSPLPWAMRLAWDPINEPSEGAISRLLALYRSVRGAYEPVVFAADIDWPNEAEIVRIFGPFAAENVYGNRNDQLARLAQIIVRREP